MRGLIASRVGHNVPPSADMKRGGHLVVHHPAANRHFAPAAMDPVTIFIVATLMMLANGWVLGLMRKSFPVALRNCTETWRIATLLLAGSAVMYASRDQMPLGLASPLANGLVLLGCTGYWRALRQFYGLPDLRWMLAPAAVGILGILWFAVLRPDTRMGVHSFDLLRVLAAGKLCVAGVAEITRWCAQPPCDGKPVCLCGGVHSVSGGLFFGAWHQSVL